MSDLDKDIGQCHRGQDCPSWPYIHKVWFNGVICHIWTSAAALHTLHLLILQRQGRVQWLLMPWLHFSTHTSQSSCAECWACFREECPHADSTHKETLLCCTRAGADHHAPGKDCINCCSTGMDKYDCNSVLASAVGQIPHPRKKVCSNE